MQDKWMNIGYENDELKPYLEPIPDLNDKSRLGIIVILFYIVIYLILNRVCIASFNVPMSTNRIPLLQNLAQYLTNV